MIHFKHHILRNATANFTQTWNVKYILFPFDIQTYRRKFVILFFWKGISLYFLSCVVLGVYIPCALWNNIDIVDCKPDIIKTRIQIRKKCNISYLYQNILIYYTSVCRNLKSLYALVRNSFWNILLHSNPTSIYYRIVKLKMQNTVESWYTIISDIFLCCQIIISLTRAFFFRTVCRHPRTHMYLMAISWTEARRVWKCFWCYYPACSCFLAGYSLIEAIMKIISWTQGKQYFTQFISALRGCIAGGCQFFLSK